MTLMDQHAVMDDLATATLIMNQKIAVVMPVYIKIDEALILTENCIDSLGDVFLVIVDNGSDRGREYLEQMSDKYIRNEENLGYAVACNQGLKYLQQEHPELHLIAIVGNDTRISPNWQEISTEILADEKVYSVHFRVIPYDELFDYGEDLYTSGRERWCTQHFFVVDTTKGLEFFDEQFVNSYDDWDMQLRVRATGRQTAYTNKVCVQHVDNFTQKQIPEREENNRKNAEKFKAKHGEYAEVLFTRMYPDQMKLPYFEEFKIRR